MQLLLPIYVLAGSLLASPASATPTPSTSPVPEPLNLTSLDPLTSNTTLGVIGPTGPSAFTCVVMRVTRIAVEPKDLFVTVIRLLEEITPRVSYSPMPEAQTIFSGPNNLVIFVASINPNSPVTNSIVMWALSRILLTMNADARVGYNVGTFEMRWRGVTVGTLEVEYNQRNDNSTMMTSGSMTSLSATNATATLGDDLLLWTFSASQLSPMMTMWDVALGTVGALISAAYRPPGSKFEFFIGDFLPDSRAVSVYRASRIPTQLSKSILIRTLAAAALWAINDGDFHNLDVSVMLNAEPIAFGGYAYGGDGQSASGLSTLSDGNLTAVGTS